MRVLALSPHLDDAAFSAGALLASLADAGHDVAVATCLTRSVRQPTGFALACQTDKGYAPEVDYMALRRAEDVRACRLLGVGYAHWNLPEAPHRGYDSPAALFAGVRPGDSDIVSALSQNFSATLAAFRPDAVLYPACIGRHVDHLQVAAAVDQVRGRGDIPAADYYRWFDQPYLARHVGAYREVLAKARPASGLAEATARGRDYVFDFAEARALSRKYAACAAYASQVGYQFYGSVGEPVAPSGDWPARMASVLGPREYISPT